MSIREHRRVEFREPVEYSTDTGAIKSNCTALDLSEGGIRFKANQFIPLYSDMTLQVRLNTDRIFNLHGKVVWVQKVPHSDEVYQIGLAFDDSENSSLSKGDLKDFVKSHRF